MTRRNLIVMFLCTELMFQGVVINLIAFGRYWGNFSGQAFTIFVLVIAAATGGLLYLAAVGLRQLIAKYGNPAFTMCSTRLRPGARSVM